MKCLVWGSNPAGKGHGELGPGPLHPETQQPTTPVRFTRSLQGSDLQKPWHTKKITGNVFWLFTSSSWLFHLSVTLALGLQPSVLRKNKPHHCHSTPFCRLCRVSGASKCVKSRQFIQYWHVHQYSFHATCKSWLPGVFYCASWLAIQYFICR